MPKVTFVNENRTIEVERGASLRYAALENDVPLYCMWFGLSKIANCHGNGMCWTDRVEVTPSNAVTTRTLLEKAMTKFGQRRKNPNVRLACQVQVLEDCQVKTRCRTKAG
ncbi:MAG TPA: hypothetical protein VF818_09630 [Ktedonobacterales bacterium]